MMMTMMTILRGEENDLLPVYRLHIQMKKHRKIVVSSLKPGPLKQRIFMVFHYQVMIKNHLNRGIKDNRIYFYGIFEPKTIELFSIQQTIRMFKLAIMTQNSKNIAQTDLHFSSGPD